MPEFTFNISVDAESQKAAEQKMSALAYFDSVLSNAELIELSQFLEDSPTMLNLIRNLIKKYKDIDYQNLNFVQKTKLIGEIISQIKL